VYAPFPDLPPLSFTFAAAILTIALPVSRTAGSQLKDNAAAQSIQCKVCLATFIVTTAEVKLKEHSDNKHPKHDFYQCFPHLKA